MDPASLPDDPAQLKQMLLASESERVRAEAERQRFKALSEQLGEALETLKDERKLDLHELAWLRQRLFGRKTEKASPNQLSLLAELTDPTAAPGGWRLIGHTDVHPFDADREPPSLFRPGAVVRFEAVTVQGGG